jgi:outer membrane autotransporter protein
LLQSKVAIAGSNISQDEIFTTVFNNAGNYTFFQKQGTAAGDVEDRAAPTLWVKAFGSKEDVDLEEYTTVETTYYGAVVGLDWDRQYTDNFDATYGVFASYVGGELKDDDWDNKVKQSGGYIGARANWYFGKLFVNGMIDYALIQNTADTTDDSNDFNSQVAGLAARVGYNFEVANKSFTIQPNLGLTGKYIITDDYDTIVDGNKIKLSIDNITNITIEPGLKLAKNLGKCWILTGEGKYVIENVSGDVTADDIVLPDTSYDNFANVGLGIEKIWGYTVLNLKANKTFGGRDGFIINAGIEFKF